MRLKSIELVGFKSFARKTALDFPTAITAIVGPNGSGKSNVAESFRFVLGEQSMKSMRGRRGEDMIWNGSAVMPRSGRASAQLVFDNSDRVLNLDFDEVAIERIVHRDGVNEYRLNGSNVRLRDITELLSQANIGASGHHIISQGEADRVLSASSKERREMLEDALGLTSFFYKREEAERKLEKTDENMREVETLRREIAPHLRFLQSQLKKIEEAERLRKELAEKYFEYLKREEVYLRLAELNLNKKRSAPKEEYQKLNLRIDMLRQELTEKSKKSDITNELVLLEKEERSITIRREELMRAIGRAEGVLATQESFLNNTEKTVPYEQVERFALEMELELQRALKLDDDQLRKKINDLVHTVKLFAESVSTKTLEQNNLEEIKINKISLEEELKKIQISETDVSVAIASLRKKIENEKDANRDAERELFAAMARRSELENILTQVRSREEALVRERESFRLELGEAGALVGNRITTYASYNIVVSEEEIYNENRALQQDRYRRLERLKIRLEEAGAGDNENIIREHQEVTDRDTFLLRELKDLEISAQMLRQLIQELTALLETKFQAGIQKINIEFSSFFKLMFGGGEAALSIVKEKKAQRAVLDNESEYIEEGVDIAIALPHKRIKGLHMLSGGERALTSIALIFAMSQVNPPPFLILDETDAALDEANSRRYGDMIENLAKKSQLILITHNRETMSRAGILYGVTMSGDGVSKLLSVRFEDALAVAK